MEKGGENLILNLHLLELLAMQMRCLYLSDLRSLTPEQKKSLLWKLEHIEPKDEDIREWNDTLEYLVGAPPENTAMLARSRLIEYLSF